MAIGVFPAAKLGGLILKQVSKPIAESIKRNAKSSPIFRKYVCIPPARFYNWCETRVKMWLLHLGQPVSIAVLSEEMAIDLGANLLGEGIIFTIGAAVLINEYNRSVRKEEAKETKLKDELQQLHDTMRELFLQVEEQQATIRHLSRGLGHLDSKIFENAQKRTEKKPSNDTKPPPPQQQPPIIRRTESLPSIATPLSNKELPHKCTPLSYNYEPNQKNILFDAFKNVEYAFREDVQWNREDSILVDALNYFYRDVYKVSCRF